MLVGGAFRLYLAWTASVISRDGCLYVSMARRMTTDWRAELRRDYPLGYPALVLLFHSVTGGGLASDEIIAWQRSGQLVCVLSGVVCIPLVCCLGRRLLDRRCALVAAWIWALLPFAARLSADALTDMPHLALILSAMLCAMRGLRRRSIAPLLLAGVLSGAGSTMRTEAGEVALVAVLLALARPRVPVRWRLAASIAIVTGFAVIGGSYILLEGGRIIHKQPWFSAALSPPALVLAGLPAPIAGLGRLIGRTNDSLNTVWLACAVLYWFVPGRRGIRRRDLAVPLSLWALHVTVLLGLFIRAGYISGRHVLVLDVGVVILAAGCLVSFAQWLVVRGARFGRWADVAIVCIVSLALSPRLLRDINNDRWYARQAAHWIVGRHEGRPMPRIAATDGWVPFYAGCLEWSACRGAAELLTSTDWINAELLVLEIDEPPPPEISVPALNARRRITELRRFTDPAGRRGVCVYAITPL